MRRATQRYVRLGSNPMRFTDLRGGGRGGAGGNGG